MKSALDVKAAIFLAALLLLRSAPALGAQETLQNIAPVAPEIAAPEVGWNAILPNGDAAVIVETLPSGDFRTQTGIVISPKGIILDGDFAGQGVVLERSDVILDKNPALAPGTLFRLPDGSSGQIREKLEDGSYSTSLGVGVLPDGTIRDGMYKGQAIRLDQGSKADQTTTAWRAQAEKGPEPGGKTPAWRSGGRVADPHPQTPAQKTDARIEVPAKTSPDQTVKTPAQLHTIAELLPQTAMPGKEAGKTPPPQDAQKMTPDKTSKKEHPGKDAQAKKAPAKESPQKAPAKKTPRAKPGDHIRIPPEAIASGNLDFLEGCWQGTRPEYHSKRTVKECFCFGAGGKNGKRRINDPIGGRKCIGAASARLSSDGTLSVSSEGMPCSDGARWGAARMVCRNSGQQTPCSWQFPDVGSGAAQSYVIPFIRVESCGR